MISADTEEIVGLAGQELFYRKPVPRKRESTYQRKQRKRESEVWGRVMDLVGPPRGAARFIHVLDAGADNFEVYCHLVLQKSGWVVRAAQHHRGVLDETGERQSLREVLRKQPSRGRYELSLRARGDQPARTATMDVRFAHITMPAPRAKSAFLRRIGIRETSSFWGSARSSSGVSSDDCR
jgi:hypothetical protein